MSGICSRPATFDVYEILPGFILCAIAIVVGSLADGEPDRELVARFE